MVRDGAHRSQVYAGCACYGAPPHHEAERVGTHGKIAKIEKFTASEA
jgi:hypothetical protein